MAQTCRNCKYLNTLVKPAANYSCVRFPQYVWRIPEDTCGEWGALNPPPADDDPIGGWGAHPETPQLMKEENP